jgi:hypothetical protein
MEDQSYQVLEVRPPQMAYALLDHPDLGDRRPTQMMAEMLSLRFETTRLDSLFLALFLRHLPASIRDHLAVANHKTAAEMASHANILWDARKSSSVAAVANSLTAVSVRSSSPRAAAPQTAAGLGLLIAIAAIIATGFPAGRRRPGSTTARTTTASSASTTTGLE